MEAPEGGRGGIHSISSLAWSDPGIADGNEDSMETHRDLTGIFQPIRRLEFTGRLGFYYPLPPP
ncbi:hypothetical protein ABTL17_20085, partial [Acinetobacter baumannii]